MKRVIRSIRLFRSAFFVGMTTMMHVLGMIGRKEK